MEKYIWWILAIICLVVLAFFSMRKYLWWAAGLIGLASMVLLVFFFGGWLLFLLGLIILPGGFFLLVYFYLAPNNLFWTFVDEGTARIVLKGKDFHKCLISWKGYTFKITKEKRQENEIDNWEIVSGDEPSHFLGLQWVGWWPAYTVLEREHKWIHMHQNGTAVPHEELQDFIMLKTDMYVAEYPLVNKKGVEDIDGVPMGLKILLPLRVGNPYEAVLRFREVFGIFTIAAKASARSFIPGYRIEDLRAMRAGKNIEKRQEEKGITGDDAAKQGDDLKEKLFKKLKGSLINEAQDRGATVSETSEGVKAFGLILSRTGCDVIDIDPDPDYREATTMAYRAEREKEKAEIEAEARLAVSKLQAQQKAFESGGMHSVIEKMLKESGTGEKEAARLASEYVKYFKGAETGVLHDWRFSGQDGSGVYAEIAKIAAIIDAAKGTKKQEKEKTDVKPGKGAKDQEKEGTNESESSEDK